MKTGITFGMFAKGLWAVVFSASIALTGCTCGDCGSSAYNETGINNTVFFAGNSGATGMELWKTDGTAAGTVLVKEINPGLGDSLLSNFTEVGGKTFFTATGVVVVDGVEQYYGKELWVTDGTRAGTVVVKDINSNIHIPNQTYSSNPSGLTNANGTLFFAADDGVNGIELWKSDGTEAGTVLVKDIWTGADGSGPKYMVNIDGTLYFAADDGVNGYELWKSDGTEAGTVMLKDIWTGATSSGLRDLTNMNGTLFFTANDGVNGYELWMSDGTGYRTVMVKDINVGLGDGVNGYINSVNGYYGSSYLTEVNGTLFFMGNDGVNGYELWKSDGSEAGTVMVKDINAGTGDSSMHYLISVNGTLFFSADDGIHGDELWKSDGTDTGTVLVKDIDVGTVYPQYADSSPRYLTNIEGTLYFTAEDYTNGVGRELWKSDGTEAGTVMVKDIATGTKNGAPYPLAGSTQFQSGNGLILMAAYTPEYGVELWKSDGTDVGTVLVKDVNPAGSSRPEQFTQVGNLSFFSAEGGLWVTNGTAAGSHFLKDITPDFRDGSMVDVNGTLIFSGRDTNYISGLWKSDGTTEGTVLVKQMSTPEQLIAVNGLVFFEFGGALWKSDGTEAGTVLIKDISPANMTNANGTLFFSADDGINGRELWKSDGTEAGTVLVKDIATGVTGSISSYDPPPVVINDILFFAANDGVNGKELWKSDGTAAGTIMVEDINIGAGNSSPSDLTNVNGTLFFLAVDPVNYEQIWMSDGTALGTTMVTNFNLSWLGNLTNLNGTLMFTGKDYSSYGNELWKSDGTSAGTVIVKDIEPGTNSSSPSGLTVVDGTLFFYTASDGFANKLWKSNGSAAGTVMVKDGIKIYANTLTSFGNKVIFEGWDGVHGIEPFVSNGSAAGTVCLDLVKTGDSGTEESWLP